MGGPQRRLTGQDPPTSAWVQAIITVTIGPLAFAVVSCLQRPPRSDGNASNGHLSLTVWVVFFPAVPPAAPLKRPANHLAITRERNNL